MTGATFSQASVDQDESWDQEVRLYVGGSAPFYHAITPITGQLQIQKTDGAGTQTYWTGLGWTAIETTLATTITGTRSRYPFMIPGSAENATLVFTGWIVRNGKSTPPAQHIIRVSSGVEEGDIEFAGMRPIA